MTPDELTTEAEAAWPAWPGADRIAFKQFIEGLAAGGAPLEELHGSDLWLAFHAGHGVAPAVVALEAACFADLHAVLRARRADPAEAEEVVQRVRHRLLVPEPGEPSRILTYGGRGELRAWVRVAAVRTWLNLKRENPVGAATAESAEDTLINQAAGDLELELLKGKYRETFRRVFMEALNALDANTRLLLKLHYIDRLAMEEVGKILGLHRITVLRRLERAREELSEGTKQRLEVELRLAPTEVDSLLRLIQSRLDVSLQTALAPPSDHTK